MTMDCMKKLLYSHERAISLAEVMYSWLYRVGSRVARTSLPGRLLGRRARRILTVGLVVVVLVAEFVMLYTLAELIDLCVKLMEVWCELAAKHLELTLDRTQG